MTTSALAAWLLADDGPIAEDERIARAATTGPWEWGIPHPLYWHQGAASEDLLRNNADQQVLMTSKAGAILVDDAAHIAAWHPARVLAECAAKRQIIEAVDLAPYGDTPWAGCGDDCEWKVLDWAVRLLAQPYAGRPGWRDEWARP